MTDMRTYRTASGRTVEASAAAYGSKAFKALGIELYSEGLQILEASLPLVPVDTGALRGSGYVSEPEIKESHLTVEIGYGGVATKINPKTGEPTTAYALEVHENLEAHHNVGQAKYLQVPFDDRTKGMGTRIAEHLQARMHGASQAPNGDPGEVPK